MLKGFVSGEEKDIVRIPMEGKNVMPVGEKKTTVSNGVTFDSDGNGRYHVYGTATGEATAKFNLARGFITPISVSNNGQGTLSFFNNQRLSDVTVAFYNGTSKVDDWVMSPLQRTSTAYNVIGNKYVDNIVLRVPSGTQVDMLITPEFTNDGVLPTEFTPHYQEGWEVRDSQDRLIWGREDELQTATGTLPFKGYSLPLKTKSLLGNAVQNGTPAPDNIIMPEMCGVRTGNLFDPNSTRYHMGKGQDNRISNYATGAMFYIKASPNTEYTIKIHNTDSTFVRLYLSNNRIVENSYISYNVISESETTINPEVTISNTDYAYLWIQTGGTWYTEHGGDSIMLNAGSTALPYEPYGWKVPFENHGENLLDESSSSDADATHINYNKGAPVILTAGQTYTFSCNTACNGLYIRSSADDSSLASANNSSMLTYTPQANVSAYFRIWNSNGITNLNPMFNAGSIPKPYSPYLNLNETIPIYLGEVPTVRRVRKLVLNGTETGWTLTVAGNIKVAQISLQPVGLVSAAGNPYICSTHYIGKYANEDLICRILGDGDVLRFYDDANATSADDWKAYLASEYSAGHPVTIWYVLGTPETTISNEPLCKISTYADELTTIQVHGLSAPLYGIGDYKDTLNLSTGVVTRKVKRLVLDGTENSLRLYTNSLGKIGFSIEKLDMLRDSRTNGFCTHFVPVQSISWVSGNNVCFGANNAIIYFVFSDVIVTQYNITDLPSIKTYLQAQYANGTPVTIWYVLSTPETETVTVPTGMTGEIEGYLTQVSTPTPTNRSVPKWNGVEETGGTYAVTVYTPPEIPTTTGQNTLTVDTTLAPSNLTVKGHIKELT